MPNTLYLLRHAKSSWADATLDDHDRPLQARGRRRAGELRVWMEDRDIGCDLVLCSTALRARQTLDVVLPALGGPDVRHVPRIYGAGADGIIEMLKDADEGIERIMVVGHDPVLRQTAIALAMTANGDAMDRLKRKYPTAALAALTFGSAGWRALAPGVAHLELFFAPSDP